MRRSPRNLITIDLDAVRANVQALRGYLSPDCGFFAAVKADAYGHGMVEVARAAAEAGAAGMAVATAEEAVALRDSGCTARILVMGPLYGVDQCLEMAARGVEFAVVAEEMVGMVRALRGTGVSAMVHLKVDSGMNRQGLLPSQVAWFLEAVRGLPEVRVRGVMTHFACAPEDSETVEEQLRRFLPCVERARGKWPQAEAHAANSAATVLYPASPSRPCRHTRPPRRDCQVILSN